MDDMTMTTRLWRRALPILVLSVAAVHSAWAATIGISADTYVSAAAPASSLGSQANVNVGGGNRGLLYFATTGVLPSGITGSDIAKAVLKVWVNKVTSPGSISVSAAAGAWVEGTATFATAPASLPLTSSATVLSTGYLLVDVTSIVQSWIAGGTNDGFVVESMSASVSLDSRESIGTSHSPELIIVIDTLGPQGPMGPQGLQGGQGGQGPKGLIGDAGATGATGPQGSPGPQGPKGATGVQGAAGPQGPTGSQGPKGVAGSP